MKTATFHVSIHNSTMKTSIKNALDKIEGVQEVSVDLGRGLVEVGYNEPASETTIALCIDGATT